MPKVNIEVHAIRVREDLIAERGDWLIIHADERLQVASAQQAAEFGLPGNASPAKAKTPPQRPPVVPQKQKAPDAPFAPRHKRRVSVEINGKTLSVPGLYFAILRQFDDQLNDPLSAHDLAGIGGISSSSRLSEMAAKGLLQRVDAQGDARNRPYYYVATNEGLAIARFQNGAVT